MIISLVGFEVSVSSDFPLPRVIVTHSFPPDVCSTTQAGIQVGSDCKNYHNVYLTGSSPASQEFFSLQSDTRKTIVFLNCRIR